MFVSVIIPNYNHSIFLNQRIDTVLNQTYRNFEVIILDDCSTDDSKLVIEQYRQHPQVTQIIFNESNGGTTFKQWEKGITLASGQLIWIAESDDWCEPTLLEELVQGFIKDPNCVLSYCQSYCVNNYGNIHWISQHNQLTESIDGRDYSLKYMLKNNTIFNASMVLWKKDKFPFIKKEFTTYKFCGDWLFWIELAQLGNVYVSGKILNFFRKHDLDVSSGAYHSGLNFIEALNLLSSLHLQQMISSEAYNKAMKHQFKMFWKEKRDLDPDARKKVVGHFKACIHSSIIYYKFKLSAIWKNEK